MLAPPAPAPPVHGFSSLLLRNPAVVQGMWHEGDLCCRTARTACTACTADRSAHA